jgi:hypothetical protein
MFRRVALIVLGVVLGVILREYGVPMKFAAIIAFIPFGLNEARNFTGPYEKTAHDIMHEQGEKGDRDAGRPGGVG